MGKHALPKDAVEAASQALEHAWKKYDNLFDDTPHGTAKQLAALLQLAGGEEFLIRIGRAAEVAKMVAGMRQVAQKK